MSKIIYDKLDYFKILNITPDDSEDIIRQKYRELAKFWHPDYNKDPQAITMFQKISVAYETLKDEQTRLKYILLSMIYDTANFPNMDALVLLKSIQGQEDLNLRAFHLTEITGKGLSYTCIDKVYYCTPSEALSVVKSISKHNWKQGFLGLLAIPVNFKAIFQNITNINNKKDNFLLLIHNAVVYNDLGQNDKALTLATAACEYADKKELSYVQSFIGTLGQVPIFPLKKWNFSKLVKAQLIYPFFICLIFFILGCYQGILAVNNINKDTTQVKKTVVFYDGKKTYSDVAVAKIFNIPVDVYDKNQLYHTINPAKAMHGADESFDVYKEVEAGTTVRITGYTVDDKWLRVMFDNGDTAFILKKHLEKGIGNPIPLWSKIYKEN